MTKNKKTNSYKNYWLTCAK